jgi:cell division transport system permease protein
VSLARALRYFAREAVLNLLRSWRVSLLAVLTITVSLVLGGAFLVASRNLAASVESWRGQLRVVLYLRADARPEDLQRLATEVRSSPWVQSAAVVTAVAARQRFRATFPSLADLVDNQEGAGEPLPPSIEIALRPNQGGASVEAWLAALRQRPEVAMVDDDREWLGQVETAVAVVRVVGLVLGGILLGAAIFTIAIMRLVGATEFFIRGPFYVEGLVQGLLGGALASGALFAGYRLIQARSHSLLASILAAQFLSLRQLGLLLVFGALAGLTGAVASLRRESL